MPRHVRQPTLPLHHPIHGVAGENSERVLLQAANDNAVYEQEAALAAQTVDLMRTGVNESVARLLAWKMAVPVHRNSDLPVARMVREERIDSELYRAVHGQELSGNRHYGASANVAHMNADPATKIVEHLENIGRAAGTVVGMNNFVEARLEERFGTPEQLLRARNTFLANQLLPVLTGFAATPAIWNQFELYFHLNTPVDICARLAVMPQIELRRFARWLDNVNGTDVLRAHPALERLYHPINEDKALGRRLNLALRLVGPLTQLQTTGGAGWYDALWNAMPSRVHPSGVAATPAPAPREVAEALSGCTGNEISAVINALELLGLPIARHEALLDLQLLVNAEQRADTSLAAAEVSDHQNLRRFWEEMRRMGGDEGALVLEVEDLLELNSFHELEKNPEAKALLQVLRTKVNDTNIGAADIRTILRDIRANELPNAERDDATRKAIEESRKEFQTVRNEAQDSLTSLIALRRAYADAAKIADDRRRNLNNVAVNLSLRLTQRKSDLNRDRITAQNNLTAALVARRGGAGAHVTVNIDPTSLQKKIDNIDAERVSVDKDLSDLALLGESADCMASELAKVVGLENESNKRKDALEEGQKKARDIVMKLRGCGARKIVGSQYDTRLKPLMDFMESQDFTDITTLAPGHPVQVQLEAHEKNAKAVFDYLYKEIVEVKTTPFILLQRLLRRDYYAQRNLPLDNKVFNEEANEYALTQALLMVGQASDEHVDLLRSGNDKAARHMKRHPLLKVWDTFARGVDSTQDALGLEMINIENLSAESFLEKIVRLHPDFAVFHGVNKYMTARDVRDLMNKSGQEVRPETLERFARILEEGIGKFQKIPPHLRKGVQTGDWDMENLVVVLKKLRTELWIKNFLAEVKKGPEGEREKILISMLSGARKKDKEVSAGIVAEVKHPDAIWRRVMVKEELKRILNPETVVKDNKIREAGVAAKMVRIDRLQKEIEAGGLSDAAKAAKEKEIENLKADNKVVEAQIASSKDLYERVEEARKYIRENKLSRREKAEYLRQMGLTEVFNKMAVNFRAQNAWEKTKKAWAWSRKHVINMHRVKQTFSVVRLAATPVTWTLSTAGKIAALPFRAGWWVASGVAGLPGRLWRSLSDEARRKYIEKQTRNINNEIAKIAEKQAKLNGAVPEAVFSWDKKRLLNKIADLEEKKQAWQRRLAKIQASGDKKAA